MKVSIPHIHKIEGEMGFFAEVARTGQIKKLKLTTQLGLRQIEGILVGRRAQDVPIVVSRICGICPVVHILNACLSLEKALEIQVSEVTTLLRKLFLASQIIHSHALHLFFMSLPDFLNIENDLDLFKKFKKESEAAIKIRDFALTITKIIGGRKVHPVTPTIGGFRRYPDKKELKKVLADYPATFELALFLIETLAKINYPQLLKSTDYLSLFMPQDYAFYRAERVKIGQEVMSIGDFYSNEIEEDLKIPPVKRTKYKGKVYMLGAAGRIKNSFQNLNQVARSQLEKFLKEQNLTKEEFFQNRFYNLFSQGIEILHFLELSKALIEKLVQLDLSEEIKEVKINKGSGLSAMEAPRGTLFTYFEIDKNSRILNCNIITPTAQFLNNLEEDLKIFLPQIMNLSPKEKIKKIRSLIRVYDPCISCATH
ncbi:MAG: nickel-dependent hydrogenase large subunit [Minisyncoccales bacterium]